MPAAPIRTRIPFSPDKLPKDERKIYDRAFEHLSSKSCFMLKSTAERELKAHTEMWLHNGSTLLDPLYMKGVKELCKSTHPIKLDADDEDHDGSD